MFTKKDILKLAQKVYTEAGGKECILQRIRNYKTVSKPENSVNNYYYLYRDVYEYSDLDATLGQAALFLGMEGEEALISGCNYIEILTTLAENEFLTEYSLCDPSFDGYTMAMYIHSWLQVKDHKYFAKICTKNQREIIENWFYIRGKNMWRDRDKKLWVSFRPYCNQEIGVGIDVLTSEVIRDRDPELADRLLLLADERLMGWEEKKGNPDDTLYYNPVFVMSLYFYSVYRKRLDLLKHPNCKATFESVYQQQPANGMTTNYNWTQCSSQPMMMAMGAYLFRDGRYKWLASRMIEERISMRNVRQRYAMHDVSEEDIRRLEDEADQGDLAGLVKEEISRTKQNCYDHVWEGLTDTVFHLWYFWDDSLQEKEPEGKSCLLKKTAGNGRWSYDAEPILPEKIVFRDGWKDDDLFVLINLWGERNSPQSPITAHRYPASNEITSLVFGEPFVVQDNNQTQRDRSISRSQTNGFNVYRNKRWLNPLHDSIGTENVFPETRWMTNAQLQFFHTFDLVDGAKSTLFQYYGWISERTTLLCKEKYFVVFDQAVGAVCDTAGVRWHLQGKEIIASDYSLVLKLLDRKMNVLFPHEDGWYCMEKKKNTNIIPVYQHHADIDLDFIGRGDRLGFVTVFAPEKAGRDYSATVLRVSSYGSKAYPEAMGIAIDNDIIGTRLSIFRADYDYGKIRTDAQAFLMRQEAEGISLTIFRGSLVRLPGIYGTDVKMAEELNSHTEEVIWYKEMLYIRFDSEVSGSIKIIY